MVPVAMYVCSYTSDQPYVHLGLGVPNLCQIPKWSSTKMAAVTYGSNICHRQLQTSRYANETQRKLQTIPQTMIAGSKQERILATTLPPNSKISQDPSHIHSCSLSLFPFCIQLICSSHSHGYTICTCHTLLFLQTLAY